MQKLAELLDKNNIPYEWEIYTNKIRQTIGNHVVYKDPKMDIIEEIAKADYLVQLSDCEAFCYSIVESLMVGTPVIATDLPVLKELNVNEKNAFICDFNMSNVNVLEIAKKPLKVAYKPPKSNWNKYLDNNTTYNPNELIKVRTKKAIWLIEEDKHVIRGQETKLKRYRASELECKDYVEIL